jgi:hypothetical protein
VNCPLGIHGSRRGEGGSGAKSGPSYGHAERQSVARFRLRPTPLTSLLIQRGRTLPRELTGHSLYRI